MKAILRIVLGVAVACVSALAAYLLVGKLFEHLRAPAALTDWKVRTVAGLTLDSPGDFKNVPINFGSAQQLIDSAENYKFETKGFEVDVIRTSYKEGIELNLDGAVSGGVDAIARLDGVRNLKHTESQTTLGDKPARRVSVTADRWQGGIRVESLLVLHGRELSQVQICYPADNAHGAEYAARVLKSVQFAPP